jgi:hypothetical protein
MLGGRANMSIVYILSRHKFTTLKIQQNVTLKRRDPVLNQRLKLSKPLQRESFPPRLVIKHYFFYGGV